jgi:hypothetical protein
VQRGALGGHVDDEGVVGPVLEHANHLPTPGPENLRNLRREPEKTLPI